MTEALVDRLKAALADRYLLQRELGQGGMATVYLAQDLRHDRQVAVKVLRPELAAVIGAERFLQEIRVTAHLQHPHILPLFDSGEAHGFLFYVMPYIEGESLRDRLSREKQLPVDAAMEISRAVASALDYAHRHKVIHRDIKPENILLHDGQPVVADFGIALAVSVAGGHRITETGLSLGTPQYMSPEQATADRELDARSDVYSLGCVLYEMLAGEPPHTGPTVQSIIAKVLTDEPRRVRLMRTTVPLHIEEAVHKALAKLPADRFTSAQQFADALARPSMPLVALTEPAITPAVVVTAARSWLVTHRRRVTNALVIGILLAAALWGWLRPTTSRWGALPAPRGRVARFTHVLPEGQEFGSGTITGRPLLAVSPDGSSIVLVANQQLYVRAIGELEAHPVPGTNENPTTPFFSPDGQWIGYWSAATSQLKKISVRGGASVVLCEATNPFGASWGEDDTIVFAQSRGILRVSANGGTPDLVIATEPGEQAHGPQVLPDGDHVLFTLTAGFAANRWNEAQVVAQSLQSGERRTLVGGGDARFLPTGHLLYAMGDALLAVRFDPRRLQVSGAPVTVAEGVRRATVPGANTATANYGFSKDGTLAYVVGEGAVPAERVLVWVDRSGRAEPVPQLPQRAYVGPRLSLDGRRVLFWTEDGGDVWIYEIARGAAIRLTRDGLSNRPVWSPDGARVAYTSGRTAVENIFIQPSDGSGEARQVTSAELPIHADSWSPDGQALLVHQHTRGVEKIDVFAVLLGNGAGERRPLLQGDFLQAAPVFSPDGKWLAYQSNESGQGEVYITAYPGPGGKVPVSTAGGREPVWARTGELFYRSLDGRRMMAVRIVTMPKPQVGEPRLLFEGRYETGTVAGPRANYDVTPDGQRFLMVTSGPTGAGAPAVRPQINVVLNWFEELNARAPRP